MMKVQKAVLGIVSILLFSFYAQPLLAQSDHVEVGSIDGEPVYYSELTKAASTEEPSEVSLEELESFLPLYLDYKAKLRAAKDEGLFEDQDLLEEYKRYTTQAAYAYWLEKEVKQKAFEAYKEKAAFEIKTFHVLVALPSNAGEDTVRATIERLNVARNEILNGAKLEEVNAAYSTERGGRSMGGDIPWITNGVTVPAFENVAYSLDVGELSKPFRTQFGYHILLLQGKRERNPARLVRHIFVRAAEDSSSLQKVQAAYTALQGGEPWSEVVQEYTEDKSSQPNDGRLGWVSYDGRLSPDFIDPVMAVNPSLPYSEPFRSNYGYHIIKIDSIESYPTAADKEAALMKQFEDSPYYQENDSYVRDYLKSKYAALIFPKVITNYTNWLATHNDRTFEELQLPASLREQTLSRFDEQSQELSLLHAFIQDNYGSKTASDFQDQWVSEYMNFIIDNALIDLTIEAYPSFEEKAQGFMNGLAVYKMNDLNIWSTATVDTARLRSIYEANPADYSYPDRPYYYYLTAVDDSSLLAAQNYIREGGNVESLDARFDDILVNMDSTTAYTQQPYDRLASMEVKSFSEIFEYNSLKGLFWLEDRLPARKMTFEEAFEQVHSRFQPQREKEWMQQLRASYNVKVYPDKLREAYKKESN